MFQHEVSRGFVRRIGRNYFMILTIDGQKKQRKTGTNDPEKAAEMLEQWKAEARVGHRQDTRLRYEDMRDNYIESGADFPDYIRKQFDIFFKDIRVAAITVDKLKEYRTWRESSDQERERRIESIAKETALRILRQGAKVAAVQRAQIEAEATQWVENGIKATTNRHLSTMRAMLNRLAKDGKISKADVPAVPMAPKVDNVKKGFLDREDFAELLAKIPAQNRAFVNFVYETGMRSGAAESLTWDMVDRKITELHVPGNLQKNGEDLVLPLVDKKGNPLPCFRGTVDYLRKAKRVQGGVLFNSTNHRKKWRETCAEMGYGILDKKKESYRGLSLHDFRRSACRNMVRDGIPQLIAQAVSGHKTDSMFRRYAIKDTSLLQDVLSRRT